jgi:Uma2 family endonuclease
MVVTLPVPAQVSPGEYIPMADQRVFLRNVPWAHYEVLLALKGEKAVPRIAYLDGVVELMMPSQYHERFKSYIGRLIETYALERDLRLSPYGSWTLKHAPKDAGAEPDECYIIGADQSKPRPDLVIEVIWTSGGIDKLEIYKRLGVGEVWFWQDGHLALYALRRGGVYEQVPRSECLPDLDLDLLCSFLDRPTAIDAMRDFRDALRRSSQVNRKSES